MTDPPPRSPAQQRKDRQSPEEQLELFLASLQTFRRKEFENGHSSFTQAEWGEWLKAESEQPEICAAQRREHERLLRRIPSKFQEYQKRQRREWTSIVDYLVPLDQAEQLGAQLELGKWLDEQLEEGALVCQRFRGGAAEGEVRSQFPQFFEAVIDVLPESGRQRFYQEAKLDMNQLALAGYIGEVKALSGSYALKLRTRYRTLCK